LKLVYTYLVCGVLKAHIPALSFMNTSNTFSLQHADKLCAKSEVIALPVIMLDEMKQSDMIEIMEYYENLLTKVYGDNSDLSNLRVHIGGDQLTRDRESSAKRLRATANEACMRFEHLSPITCEFFHLLMKVLEYVFKILFKDESIADLGTMSCEKERINRSNVHENVKQHYDADKDFFVSFTDAYVVESFMEYSNMDDTLSSPASFPLNATPDEKQEWAKETVEKYVDKVILQISRNHSAQACGSSEGSLN